MVIEVYYLYNVLVNFPFVPTRWQCLCADDKVKAQRRNEMKLSIATLLLAPAAAQPQHRNIGQKAEN